jgi:MFS family permease
MNRAPAAPDRTAWLIVGIGFLALSLAFSARSVLGLLMPIWEAELGWSRTFVSTSGALAMVVMAAVAPLAGNLVDRVGPRGLMCWGLAALGGGALLVAVADSPWLFLLAFSGLAGIGFGVVATHVISTTIALNFRTGAGLPTGIATSGATAGQLLVVPLLAAVVTTMGWRPAMAVLGIGALLLIPVVIGFVRTKPTAPHGARTEAVEPLSARLSGLLRRPVFHALFWSYVICGFTTSGVIETHLLPYAAACGFPPLDGAAAYGVLSGVNMVGMIAAGYLTDRVHRPRLLAAIYFLRALSFIPLFYIVGDLPLLFAFAVMFGLFDYSTIPVTASLVASHIGLRVMGLSMGLLAAGHALGGAAGAFLGGVLFDLFARYTEMWLIALALAFLAGLIVLTIPERGGSAIAEPAAA